MPGGYRSFSDDMSATRRENVTN